MAIEFMESRETFEGFNEYNSGYDLIQMQLNEAIAAGDEDLVRYYKNQFAKMQSMTENDAKAGKDIKLGGGLSAYQVLRMGANDDLRKAEELRRKGNSSEADYYENRGNATMKRYEAAVAQNKAQQISLSISLMQKRMDCYCVERSVLESIIDYQKPSQKQLEDLCHLDLESRFLFGDEIKEHLKAVIELTEHILNHKKSYVPDGEGGFFDSYHDYDEEMFSQEASCMYGAAIDLYGRYIDFSSIGVMDKKRGRKNEARSKRKN